MRIRVSHEIIHRFAPPARTVNQILRLTPLSFDSQYVLRWRIDVDADGALRETEDAHGNAVASYSHHGLIERLAVSAAGEVETGDAAGVVRAPSSGCRRRCICARARSLTSMGRCATSPPKR